VTIVLPPSITHHWPSTPPPSLLASSQIWSSVSVLHRPPSLPLPPPSSSLSLAGSLSSYQLSIPLHPQHPFSPPQSSTSTTTALVHLTLQISRHLLLFLNQCNNGVVVVGWRYGGDDECRSGCGL
ncbi:hypothetical protein L195_g050860, partial [Trifolium pratense]